MRGVCVAPRVYACVSYLWGLLDNVRLIEIRNRINRVLSHCPRHKIQHSGPLTFGAFALSLGVLRDGAVDKRLVVGC